MILDTTHRRWGIAAACAGVLAAIAYVVAERSTPGGVTGGSTAGLAFGITAAGLMVFEALLAVRSRRPAWRLGRASTWMRGHIWLGFLAVPLALFHAGFSTGGVASTCLMILLLVVTASGILGLALQQVLPRMMTARVEMETIYEQIPHVVKQLQDEARDRVAKVGAQAGHEELTRFFTEEMEDFLIPKPRRDHRLADAGRADALFGQLRRTIPQPLHETVADLAHICEERRQLAEQERLHRWLHGWLLVHVPASYALLLLLAAHVVMTLRY